MKSIFLVWFAFFFILAVGCTKSEEGTSETSSAPESLYKGQTRALEKAKDLKNITEKALKKKATTLDDDNQ
ncbi:MAG TPA: hypothetical protein EYN60_09065 [Nitrospirales bacterium]|nr:hypothetical protein [Nitrospirales bacterium]